MRLHVLVGQLLHALLGAALLVVADVAVLARAPSGGACASRRTLRTATRPSSARWRTTLTSSLRRSSVSCGIGRRMSLPSFDGVRPRSDSWIARSIALHRARVVRLHGEQARLGHVDRRELVERRRRAVVVDLDAVEQRRRGAPGAHGVELVRRRLDRLVHAPLRVVEQVVDHASFASSAGSRSTVPTRSPAATRDDVALVVEVEDVDRHPFSMQSESAVVSITLQAALERLAVRELRQELRVRVLVAGRRRRRRRRRSCPSGSPRRRSRARAARPPCRS